jgi:hypothetical protein
MEKVNIQKIKDLILENIEEAIVLKKISDKNVIAAVSDNPNPKKGGNETYRNRETFSKNGFTFDRATRAWTIPADQAEQAAKVIALINKTEKMIVNLEELEEMVADAASVEPDKKAMLTGRIETFINDLAGAVDERAADAQIKHFFSFLAKFRDRSPRNQLLIYLQNPNATKVAGYTAWRDKFHRGVKKNPNPLYIFAPITYKSTNKNDDGSGSEHDIETNYVGGFKVTHVYDISDTYPLDERGEVPETPKWWGDNTPSETADELFAYAKTMAIEHGIAVTANTAKGNERGYSAGGHINLSSSIEGVGRLSTMIHEMAHELMHWKGRSKFYTKNNNENNNTRELQELQAESVSYIVLKHYDLDVKHHATYLALWKANKEKIMDNMSVIGRVAMHIIESIEKVANTAKEKEQPKQETAPTENVFESWIRDNKKKSLIR